MKVISLDTGQLLEAAGLFARQFKSLRQFVPILPERMEDASQVQESLAFLAKKRTALAALEDGQLVGYLGWFIVENFRDTDRRGAYTPEWGHAAAEGSKMRIYQALYREAATLWARAKCQVHAITLLSHDQEGLQAWFWNGFGLAVIDAIRPARGLETAPVTPLKIRKARPSDAPILATLEIEHRRHYTQPPIFMAPRENMDQESFLRFIEQPGNSIWLALDGEDAIGFLRFDADDPDGVDILRAKGVIKINGAYVRPAYRGQSAAPAMLNAALQDYANLNFEICALDFESFNPEAAAFWLKYFQPVCLSVMRMPESLNSLH